MSFTFTMYPEHDIAPTHALVKFLDEEGQPMCVLPTKRIKNSPVHTLKEECTCEVQWSDGTIYKAKVLKIGKVTCIMIEKVHCTHQCGKHVILGDESTIKKQENELNVEEEGPAEKPPKRRRTAKKVLS